MTLLAGSIFSLGFRIALQGDNNPVMPPSAAQVPKYLHLVDADGNTLVPVLVPDGLTTPEGPVAGLRWTIPISPAAFAELEAAIGQAQSDISNLDTAVNTAQSTADSAAVAAAAAQASADALAPYAVYGGRWEIPPIVTPAGDGEDVEPSVGQFVRVDFQNLGTGDTFTVVLPEVTGGDLGRRVGVTEVGGSEVGGGQPHLAITTTAGQQIDINITLPYQLTGFRPRIVFVVALISTGPNVYGWTIESIGNAA